MARLPHHALLHAISCRDSSLHSTTLTTVDTQDWVKDGIVLQVYFKKLSYQLLLEEVLFDINDLIGQ